jgi:hypothetical protein
MIEMFLGSLVWHFPKPRKRRIHGGREPLVACCLSAVCKKKKKITPSSSDKTLIGPAHSPGNKGAGPPRQKVQTERLIGPLTPESGHPARAASPEHTQLSPTGIPKRAGPARPFGNGFFNLCLVFPHHQPTQRTLTISKLYTTVSYTFIFFFSSATFCFIISGPSSRHLLL